MSFKLQKSIKTNSPKFIIFNSPLDSTIINTTINTTGRFGNIFFRNMLAHFICKQNNLKFDYAFFTEFKKLGIELFSGTKIFSGRARIIYDNSFIKYLKSPLLKNIDISKGYYQTREFALYLREYFNQEKQRNSIMEHNEFKELYQKNDNVYIHVRLGDVPFLNPGFNYYDKILSKLNFKEGYISSDSINHEICQKLIEKYKLKIIEYKEVKTIMFASTCKYIILSQGTFSWLIGLLAFFSEYIGQK